MKSFFDPPGGLPNRSRRPPEPKKIHCDLPGGLRGAIPARFHPPKRVQEPILAPCWPPLGLLLDLFFEALYSKTWLSWNGKRVRSESLKQVKRSKRAKIAANTASGDEEEAPRRTRTTTSGTARASRQRARAFDWSLAPALRAAASALRAGNAS